MNILVTTIMHSGTHVLRYQILKAFFQDGDTDCYFNGNSGNTMVKCHVDQLYRFQKELDTYPVFTSLRHPRRIAASFRQRRALFNNKMNNYTEESFHRQFRALIDEVAPKGPFYLHMDDDIKDKEVEVIGEFLDLPLKPNWEVSKRSGAVCGNHDIKLVDCPEVPQEYEDFYYDTIELMRKLHGSL